MSFKVQAPPLAQNITETKNADPAQAAAAAASTKKAGDAKKVGQDFEAILVRQMLSTSNVGGTGSYGDMAREALSSAVTKGGGLGLGHVIERQLAPHDAPSATGKASIQTGTAQASAAVSAFKKLSVPAKSASGMTFSIPEK